MPLPIPLIPRQPVPDLTLPLVGGGRWSLSGQTSENFTLVVFYRGLHCPACSTYLGDLNRKAGQFRERGVTIVVVSNDDEGRAGEAKDKWGLDALDVAYGLPLDEARRWGLYTSAGIGKTSIGIEEPALFSEPGVFLIRPDGTLFFGSVQTMPFARPGFGDILKGVDFAIARNYPARGEVVELAADVA